MIYKTDEDWMKIALKYAFYAKKKGEVPIGSILVFKEKIIGTGWNRSISTHDPTAHAEITAIRCAAKKIQNYRLINTTLYVTLEPCVMCFGAIIHSRVKRLVFGADYKRSDRKYYLKSIFLHLKENYKLDIKNNVMKNECSNILVDFFRNKRKKIVFK